METVSITVPTNAASLRKNSHGRSTLMHSQAKQTVDRLVLNRTRLRKNRNNGPSESRETDGMPDYPGRNILRVLDQGTGDI